MKKLILIAFAICSLNAAVAQSDTATTPKYIYCEIVGTQKMLSTGVKIVIDYGEERSMWKANWIRDDSGKIQTFNSMVDALNYLGSDGWEFCQAYVVTMGQANVYHWLLKRKNE